jgi:uncharacterized membrane protein YkvA (DUF1232 family)
MATDQKKTLKIILIIGIVIAVTWYWFTPIDLLPEGITGLLAGKVDDFLAVIGGVMIIRKIIQSFNKRDYKTIKWTRYIIPLLMVGIALLYVLAPQDIIPDTIPYLGWLDDIGVMIGAALISRKLLQKAFPGKSKK